MALEVGLLTETVKIEGTPPLLESQSSVLGTVIQEQQVQELPLNGRNFVQLATLTAGVSGAGSGMRGTIMSGRGPTTCVPAQSCSSTETGRTRTTICTTASTTTPG